MKINEMIANIALVPPNYNAPISDDSIIIKDSDTQFLIGADARVLRPGAIRQMGINLENPQYIRLMKGAAAHLIGAKRVKESVALSVPHNLMKHFRSKKCIDVLTESLKEIEFKTGHSNSEWQKCAITVKDLTRVVYEYQAVFDALPKDLYSFLLWQIGFGDWQQVLIHRRKPLVETTARIEGMQGALRLFAKRTGLPYGDAMTAWEQEEIKGGMDGNSCDYTSYKIEACRGWINDCLGELIPNLEKMHDRFNAVIVSGGLCKDKTFWKILEQETAGSPFKVLPINKIPGERSNKKLENPSLTTIHGMANSDSTLLLDIGNGRLKGGWVN